MGTTGIKPEALYGQSQITMSHKRKRTAFSINQKQEIICYQDQHPNASHQTIADHFATVSDSQNPGDDVDADSDSDDTHSQPPPPTTKDATAALDVFLRYVECNDLSEQTDLDMVLTLQKKIDTS